MLSGLEWLDLEDNQLVGEIPTVLGNLENLRRFNISGNQLTGCIPVGLRDVVSNDFDELGLPFCDVARSTCVTGGAVTDATNEGLVSDCEALLRARDTLTGSAPLNWSADTPIAQWEGVTVDGAPQRVTALRLNDKQLSGTIPAELDSLSNLEELYLNRNRLSGHIPSELGRLDNLQRLYLSGNRLTGCIPQGLRDVVGNDFDDLGLPFCDASQSCETGVAVADVSNNPGLVSDCEALLAARDKLGGSARLDWSAGTPIVDWGGITVGGTPRRVTGVRRNARQLTGEIPTELANLPNLQHLSLGSNQLTGQIPLELGNLSNLQYLLLGSNQLTGEIPTELGNLSNLRYLFLGSNQLTGQIPTELGKLSSLMNLQLQSNQLSEEIPMELGNLAYLRVLDLPSIS